MHSALFKKQKLFISFPFVTSSEPTSCVFRSAITANGAWRKHQDVACSVLTVAALRRITPLARRLQVSSCTRTTGRSSSTSRAAGTKGQYSQRCEHSRKHLGFLFSLRTKKWENDLIFSYSHFALWPNEHMRSSYDLGIISSVLKFPSSSVCSEMQQLWEPSSTWVKRSSANTKTAVTISVRWCSWHKRRFMRSTLMTDPSAITFSQKTLWWEG